MYWRNTSVSSCHSKLYTILFNPPSDGSLHPSTLRWQSPPIHPQMADSTNPSSDGNNLPDNLICRFCDRHLLPDNLLYRFWPWHIFLDNLLYRFLDEHILTNNLICRFLGRHFLPDNLICRFWGGHILPDNLLCSCWPFLDN